MMQKNRSFAYRPKPPNMRWHRNSVICSSCSRTRSRNESRDTLTDWNTRDDNGQDCQSTGSRIVVVDLGLKRGANGERPCSPCSAFRLFAASPETMAKSLWPCQL